MALGNQGQIGPYRAPTSGMLRLSSLQQDAPYSVEYLVVAGGGGGSARAGGGAGGFLAASNNLVTAGTSYVVTIGAGGASGGTTSSGVNGSDSVFSTKNNLISYFRF
jgi:hypothetical protein